LPLYALDPGVRLIRSTTQSLPEIEQVISLVVFFRPVHGLLYLILMHRQSSIEAIGGIDVFVTFF